MGKALQVQQEQAPSGTPLAIKAKDSARRIWLAGLGAYGRAETEGGRVFETLVAEGEAVEKRIFKAARETTQEIRTRAGATQDRLEAVFEKRVARALQGLGIPSQKEVQDLTRQMEALSAQVQALSEAKPKAHKAAA